MKGVAWATPAIAVAAIVPKAAASLLPCVSEIKSTGGTYPVSVALSGCSTSNTHWDFNFKITAALQGCDCEKVRITFFDNPKRSRLWISDSRVIPNPTSNTANSPQLYVQKELLPGETATFPAPGDQVRVVSNNQLVGTIGAHGTADDSLHVLINPAGGNNTGLPCNASGPMATYKVECFRNGVWTTVGENGVINPCVPMISVDSVCRTSSSRNGLYRLGITVRSSCGVAPGTFRIRNIQRNSDSNFPTQGSSVWSGDVPLSNGTTYITTTNNVPSGSSLWVSFTTDNGVNTSIVRVNTSNSSC